jgi:hypothetical protein
VGVTFTSRDGTPYRADPESGIVQARPEHVADLEAQGFTLATATQVPAGTPLQDDVGWQEDVGDVIEEQ